MGLTFGSGFKRPFEELQLLGHFSALPLFFSPVDTSCVFFPSSKGAQCCSHPPEGYQHILASLLGAVMS